MPPSASPPDELLPELLLDELLLDELLPDELLLDELLPELLLEGLLLEEPLVEELRVVPDELKLPEVDELLDEVALAVDVLTAELVPLEVVVDDDAVADVELLLVLATDEDPLLTDPDEPDWVVPLEPLWVEPLLAAVDDAEPLIELEAWPEAEVTPELPDPLAAEEPPPSA